MLVVSRATAAVIVQYNNWSDTLLCLESVLQSACPPRWVIVVDNASTNGAVDAIKQWAAGYLPSNNEAYADLLPRSIPKPYPLSVTTPDEAVDHIAAKGDDTEPRLLLVRNTVNTGYPGGNNVGLRVGLAAGADAFWILNNDTIVDPDACGALCARLFACKRPGLAGGLVCYLAAPDMVQCRAGGYTNPWFFLSRMNGHMLPVSQALQSAPEAVEANLNFIYGASVMVSRTFVESVGLMDERLFLYCEEQDWSWRSKRRFDLAYAPDARIFHKEGGSTTMSRLRRPIKRLLLLARNKLLVTGKHKPAALPFTCLGIAFAFFRLIARRMLRARDAG